MSRPAGRGAATTLTIENAALDLVLELGYDQVTVDMICDAAKVSQRTFFNHFPTKDDAVLGKSTPEIDERGARKFIAAKGPILLTALDLVGFADSEPQFPARFVERMQVISETPSLISKQMDRINALHRELAEIIELRLSTEHPDLDHATRCEDAELLTNLLAGVFRSVGTSLSSGCHDMPVEELTTKVKTTLMRVLERGA